MFGLKTNIKGKIWIHLGAHPSNCSQNITIYCLVGDIGWYKSRVLSQWCLTFPFENNNDGFHLYIYIYILKCTCINRLFLLVGLQ